MPSVIITNICSNLLYRYSLKKEIIIKNILTPVTQSFWVAITDPRSRTYNRILATLTLDKKDKDKLIYKYPTLYPFHGKVNPTIILLPYFGLIFPISLCRLIILWAILDMKWLNCAKDLKVNKPLNFKNFIDLLIKLKKPKQVMKTPHHKVNNKFKTTAKKNWK